VRAGEQLPKKGRARFRAGESLAAGSPKSLNFQLWEGEILEPITDNRPIGVLKIRGKDFADGVIEAGAELVCDYEVHDSGRIVMEVSIPSIAGSFGVGHNFYSRQEDQIDYSQASKLFEEEAELVARRLKDMEAQVSDPRFEQVRSRVAAARALQAKEGDAEGAKEAMDAVHEAKRLLSLAREDHLKAVRQMELDKAVEFFNGVARPHARLSEISSFENLVKTAQRSIDANSRDFESHREDIGGRSGAVLWRQDWFVVQRFQWLASSPHYFSDLKEHASLVTSGSAALARNEIDKVRAVVQQLEAARIHQGRDDDFLAAANIVRG
jgi:molecular chaperone DnaK